MLFLDKKTDSFIFTNNKLTHLNALPSLYQCSSENLQVFYTFSLILLDLPLRFLGLGTIYLLFRAAWIKSFPICFKPGNMLMAGPCRKCHIEVDNPIWTICPILSFFREEGASRQIYWNLGKDHKVYIQQIVSVSQCKWMNKF